MVMVMPTLAHLFTFDVLFLSRIDPPNTNVAIKYKIKATYNKLLLSSATQTPPYVTF